MKHNIKDTRILKRIRILLLFHMDIIIMLLRIPRLLQGSQNNMINFLIFIKNTTPFTESQNKI